MKRQKIAHPVSGIQCSCYLKRAVHFDIAQFEEVIMGAVSHHSEVTQKLLMNNNTIKFLAPL